MKFYTKEWYNNYALKSLACIFNEFDRRMILVVCDDSMELPEIQTIKTHLDLPYFSDKEKQLRIIAKPVHFPLFEDYDKNAPNPQERSFIADFKDTYNNRLRLISLLPENIQRQIDDKRLLALGYAPKKTQNLILSYINGLKDPLNAEQEKFEKTQMVIEEALTIKQQIENSHFSLYGNLNKFLEESKINNLLWENSNLHIRFNAVQTITLTEASILEEDESPIDGEFFAAEVYQFDDHNELHLLLRKYDDDLVERVFYVTYRFKDIHLHFD